MEKNERPTEKEEKSHKEMGKISVCTLILVFLMASCDSNRVFDEYKSLPNKWDKDSVVSFSFNRTDTVHRYNLFFNVRNNNDYGYSNLFLVGQIHFPNGKVITDTLEYNMAYPNGEWMGQGFTDIKENKLWYKENVRFPEKGNYKIDIRQVMRQNGRVEGIENLNGITEVGLRIENIPPNL